MVKAKYKGFFTPQNPKKYVGDLNDIEYRSGYELAYMKYLDKHPDVLQWSSEEVIVPYKSPITGRIHRYFPDFVVRFKTTDGKVVTWMVEIKPSVQTREPKVKKKITNRMINEVVTFQINKAKWQHADIYCRRKGWIFKIITEKELGNLVWQPHAKVT